MLTDIHLWLVDLLLLAGLWALGILIVRAVVPQSGFLERAALGFGLGVACLTWLLFLLSWAGLPLTVPTILATYFVLAATVWMLPRWTGRSSPRPRPAPARRAERIVDLAGWILLGLFGLALLVVSVGLSYYYWDSMAIWAAKGYGIGLQGSIFAAREWGSKGLTYPLNLPVAIGLFYRFDGDLLPGSKLLFPAFFISLLGGLRLYLARQKLPSWAAWAAVFAVATVPLLVQYSTIGYANLAYANYYVLGVIWTAAGLADGDRRRALLGGLLLAFAIWTRLEGLEFWFIALAALALLWGRRLFSGKLAPAVLLPGALVGGVWFLFSKLNRASSGETQALSTALGRLAHGELHPQALVQIVRYTGYMLFKLREYGLLVPLAIGLALVLTACLGRLRRDRLSMTLLAGGALTGLGVMFMYYLTSYDPAGVEWWLGTGYDRMLFGAVILLAAASAPLLWRAWSGE